MGDVNAPQEEERRTFVERIRALEAENATLRAELEAICEEEDTSGDDEEGKTRYFSLNSAAQIPVNIFTWTFRSK